MFAGQRVGVINIYENGIKIDGVIAVATENIDKKSFFDVVSDIATKWSLIS